MVDSNFFKKNGNYTLGYLAEIAEGKVLREADKDILILDVAPLDSAKEGDISFLASSKYIKSFQNTKATACVIGKDIDKIPDNIAVIVSDNPYYTYAKIAQKFYHKSNLFFSVSEFAYIDSTAEIGKRTIVQPWAYIGPGCVIGDDCVIHPNVTIINSIIGDNVIIHSGTRIGQDGFGYAYHKGAHHKVPQLGRVIIENDVEIGSNAAIDRGTGPDTIIREGTKIDNLVQIAHNCEIGKHCVITAQVGIAGSTKIGDYTVIGGQAGVSGHLNIGKKVQIAAKSGVTKDIKDGEVIGGFPAVPIRDFHRQTIALKKILEKNDK